jgi:hypothetical protein
MTGLPIYFALAAIWIGAAVTWAWVAGRLGARYGVPNDGCLLGFANVVLSFVGGGIGFLLARYPWSIASSLAGTIVLPGLITWFFSAKNRHRT